MYEGGDEWPRKMSGHRVSLVGNNVGKMKFQARDRVCITGLHAHGRGAVEVSPTEEAFAQRREELPDALQSQSRAGD